MAEYRRYPLIDKKRFSLIHRDMPIVGVDLLIFAPYYEKRAIYIGKRVNPPGNGLWCVPGGRIFKNERIDNAVRRIAGEETGLSICNTKTLGCWEYFNREDPFGHGRGTHTVSIVIGCRVGIESYLHYNFEAVNQRQHSEYAYLNINSPDDCRRFRMEKQTEEMVFAHHVRYGL